MLILAGMPSTFWYPFLFNFDVIVRFRHSVEKTVSTGEPMGTKVEGQGILKSTKNMNK